MRILVEGTRGKTGIVQLITKAIEDRGKDVIGKTTGLEPAIYYKGKKIPIIRNKGRFLIDVENKRVLKKYRDVKFKIFENQALSSYTMKAFHNLFKPDMVVIPNIRYEHQDVLGETIEMQADSFAMNFKGVGIVITSEEKKDVLDIFEKYCKKYNVKLLKIKSWGKTPGHNAINLVNQVMIQIFGYGLTKSEYMKIYRDVKSRMNIKENQDIKINYYKGSKVNDIESTVNVFNFLKQKTDKDFCFIAYFRKDRPERTKAFIPIINDLIKDSRVKKIFISGNHLNKIKKHAKIERISMEDTDKIFEYCSENDLIMFTAVNGVNPFMRKIELNLEEAIK